MCIPGIVVAESHTGSDELDRIFEGGMSNTGEKTDPFLSFCTVFSGFKQFLDFKTKHVRRKQEH